jgi:hypothetical protein
MENVWERPAIEVEVESVVNDGTSDSNNRPASSSDTSPRAEKSRPAGTQREELEVITLSKVEPQPITWLWPGQIACSKLTMIAGHPGLGESLVTLDLAARVSRGSPWPYNECTAPQGT